jgi:hypothetical protein
MVKKQYEIRKIYRPNLLWEYQAFRVVNDEAKGVPPQLKTEYVERIMAEGPKDAVDKYYFEHMNSDMDLWA